MSVQNRKPARRLSPIAIQGLIFCGFVAVVAAAARAAETPTSTQKVAAKVLLAHPEVFFEPADARQKETVLYTSYGLGLAANFERDTVRLFLPTNLTTGTKQSTELSSVQLHFVKGSSTARVEGVEELEGKSNYFTGSDPKQWRTKVPHFARLAYRGVYPGVDVVFYGEQGRLEYDYVLAPGADPSAIHLHVEGARLSLSREGEVVVSSGGREVMRMKKPKAYQDDDTQRMVAADYVLKGDEVEVRLGRYDHHHRLVVDPALAFATFLMNNCLPDNPCGDLLGPMAVDSTGIYIAGLTGASVFPDATGQPPATPGNGGNFIVKLDPTGSKVLFESRFPQLRFGIGFLAVDSNGQAVFSGFVPDQPVNGPFFPLTPGSFSDKLPVVCGGCDTPYVAKLSSDGSSLIFSTLLMQDSGDPNIIRQPDNSGIGGIALDSAGAVYVAGVNSPGGGQTSLLPFPTTAGAFQTSPPSSSLGGNNYVLKLNPSGSALEYSTYVNGQKGAVSSLGFSIAVDAAGAAYVTGPANSDFPVTPGAFQTTAPSVGAGVVVKVKPDGSGLDYSTFFGEGSTSPVSIAVGADNEAVILGNGPTVPTTPGAICATGTLQQVLAFATKFNAAGSGLVYSTTLCSTANAFTQAGRMAMDSSGSVYFALNTVFIAFPPQFPLRNPIQSNPGPGPTVSLFKLDATGALQWSTFFGDTDFTRPLNANSQATPWVAVDAAGAMYFTGNGDSGTPTTSGSMLQNLPSGAVKGPYLAKIIPSLGAPQPSVVPKSLDFGGVAVGSSSAPAAASVNNLGDATLSAPTASITGDFSQTGACQNSVPPGQGCAFNVVFTPTAGGPRTGVLIVHFASGFPDQTVALSGTGLAPTATPSLSKIAFPPQPVNTTSAPQQLKIMNFGNITLNVSNIQTTGDFAQTNACGSVAVASFCLVNVTFTPTATGARNGTLTLTDNALDSPQVIQLVGAGGQAPVASLSPLSLTFTGQNLGSTSAATSVTLTNIGNLTLTISQVSASGDFSQTNNCTTVSPGSTCTLQVSFTPTAPGTRHGSVTITSDSVSSPDTVSLTGTGLSAAVSLNPTSVMFGTQSVGSTSAPKFVTLTNIGTQTLTVSQVAASGDFSQTNNCASVSVGGACTLQVSFTPTASGTRNGSVTITSNSFTSPDTVSLTGTGGDFSTTVNGSSTSTITAGQTANYSLTVAPMSGFSGTLNFTCTGAPSAANCSVSPASISLGATSQSVAITVTTTAPTAGNSVPSAPGSIPNGGTPFLAASLTLLLALTLRMRRRVRWMALAPLALMLLWIGCGGGGGGGGGNPGTPKGTYTIVVTGTGNGGSPNHSQSFTLIVN